MTTRRTKDKPTAAPIAHAKPRQKWKAKATAENPAARIARKAERKGMLRLKFD